MMKNFYFIVNENKTFELWVNECCITDCFSLLDSEGDLMEQLVRFANVPCYKKISFEEIREMLFDN
jgi:hypothetical protein